MKDQDRVKANKKLDLYINFNMLSFFSPELITLIQVFLGKNNIRRYCD